MVLAPREYAALLRLDFGAFIHRCFLELVPQTRYLPNWHIDLMAAKLDACRLGQIRQLIMNMCPRHLKSLCASIALPVWILGHQPSAKVLCVSYGQDLGKGFARDSRRIMETSWYQRIFKTRLSDERLAVDDFMTTEQGGRMTISTDGALTGRGADYIIIDDPIKADEALSASQRKKVNEWFGNTLYSRLNDKERSRMIVIMQRLHEDDLTGYLLAQGGWEHLCFPAIAVEDEEHVVETPFGTRRYVRRAGEALHPERESLETLAGIRRILGEYHFAAQYQQSPAPLEGGMIKLAQFGRYEPYQVAKIPWDQVLQSWDTANKTSELNDFSVCTTWGLWAGQAYLLHVLRKRMEYPELKRAVREQAFMHGAGVVLIEDKASGTQLLQDLVSEGFYCVQSCKPEADKVMRMHAQTAVIENGAVHLPRQAPWLAEYEHELLVFPEGKYDDQVDSTSQALDWIKKGARRPRLVFGTLN